MAMPLVTHATEEGGSENTVPDTQYHDLWEQERVLTKQLYAPDPYDRTDSAFVYAANTLVADSECHYDKILFLGDSLTMGVQSGTTDFSQNMPRFVSERIHVETVNAGVGGSTISRDGYESMAKRYESLEVCDAIVIYGGVNDWLSYPNVDFGTYDRDWTFLGDLKLFYEDVADDYDPEDVYIVIPANLVEVDVEQSLSVYVDLLPLSMYQEAERRLAREHHFNIIDLGAEQLFDHNDPRSADRFYADNVHLSSAGYEMLGVIISATIIREDEQNEKGER